MNKQRTPSATLRLLRSASDLAPAQTSDHKPLSRLADKLSCLAESLEKIARQAACENIDLANDEQSLAAMQTDLTQTNQRQTDVKPIVANNQKRSDLNQSKKARHLRLIS